MDLARLLTPPDHCAVQLAGAWRALAGSGVEVDTATGPAGLAVTVAAPSAEPEAVRLRWHLAVPEGASCLGDAWERGYGDLDWRHLVPERTMPWYVLVQADGVLHGLGVMTGGGAFAAWRLDEEGVTLELDLRNGGAGVRLGHRRLHAATVVVRAGAAGEDAHAAAHAFCRQMCPAPRLPAAPVYGVNDWYYAYGDNSAASVRRDAATLAELAQGLANRPYLVIDDGWYGSGSAPGGPWLPNAKFGDMAALARDIAGHDCIPGLWVRPLTHRVDSAPAAWRLPAAREHAPEMMVLDPTLPEVQARAESLMREVTGWGYRLVKHDFSTFDITGRWGALMGGRVTADGWRFHDDSVTTAEAVLGLYRALRRGAGDAVVLGCNTFSHLAAGLVEVQRTGDDTSGRYWERTRRMGPNTLAMRMPQHDAFYAVDADCVGITRQVPWELNRQWLDLLSRSGTPLFVSPAPDALDGTVRAALRQAFAVAAAARPVSRPLDWQLSPQPRRWQHADGAATYRWQPPEGALAACPPG